MQWYYASNGQRLGPITESEIERLAREGVILPNTLVWKQGMQDWQPFNSVSASLPGLQVPATAATYSSADDTAVCAVSGKRYPTREMIQFEGKWISAEHRDAYFQRLNEKGTATGGVTYGGFWIRVLASIIDGIIQGIAIVPIYIVLFFFVFKDAFTPQAGPEAMGSMLAMQGLLMISQIGIGLTYSWFFLRRYSATPGKMAVGLKVLRSDGSALSNGRIVGRFFGHMLSGLVFYIGYIIAGFDNEKRALHDHICDTRVFKSR